MYGQNPNNPQSPFGGQPFQAPQIKLDPKKVRKISLIALIVLVVIIVAFSCFYTVSETEEAVITTFGRVTATEGAGLHFKLPWPIQRAYLVPFNRIQKLEMGYRSSDNRAVEEESKMITGDMNIINIDFFIEWKVSDSQKYLFNSDNPERILRNVAQSSARSIIGIYDVDDALTSGKIAIQAAMFEQMRGALETYDIGVRVLEIKIQDSQPPTLEVITAFKNVETAKQDKETYINQAIQYSNQKLPAAKSEADKILRAAESQKQRRINEAAGEVVRFNEMFSEFIKYPNISRRRMYLEMIEEVLPGMTVYIDAGDGSVQKLLPIGLSGLGQ